MTTQSIQRVETAAAHFSRTNNSCVEFDAVAKTHDGATLAVVDLRLSIAKDEFTPPLGPSGSEKRPR